MTTIMIRTVVDTEVELTDEDFAELESLNEDDLVEWDDVVAFIADRIPRGTTASVAFLPGAEVESYTRV